MTSTIIKRTINAPINKVFKIVADAREFSRVLPHVVSVEFLSDTESGVGTRFRETRIMKGKEATTDLEVTEYVENEHVRIVTDSNGTVWDTTFAVSTEDGQTLLTMTMDAKAYKLLPKLLNPLLKGMIKKSIGKDMDLVKAFCEENQ